MVHQAVAEEFLPKLKEKLEKKQVEIYGCEKTRKIIDILPASEDDWKTEYLDYKLSIKLVSDIGEAIDHIYQYGSGHTDAIITNNKENADLFMNLVDSGNVF